MVFAIPYKEPRNVMYSDMWKIEISSSIYSNKYLRAEGLFTNKIVLISFMSQFMVYGSMLDEIPKAIKKASVI